MYAASTESAELNSNRPFKVSLYYLCCLFWVCWLFSINPPFCPSFSLHLNVPTWLLRACSPRSGEPRTHSSRFCLRGWPRRALRWSLVSQVSKHPTSSLPAFQPPTSAGSRPNGLRVLLCPCASPVMFASGLPLTLGQV